MNDPDPDSVLDYEKCYYCGTFLDYHEQLGVCMDCEISFHPNDLNYGHNYFQYGYITQEDFTDDDTD
jgi:hypothetical protein